MKAQRSNRAAMLATLVVIALSSLGLNAAPAAAETTSVADVSAFLHSAAAQTPTVVTDEVERVSLTSTAREHMEIRGQGAPALGDESVLDLVDGNLAVRFPMEGQGIAPLSSFTVLFDSEGTFVHTVELEFVDDLAGGGSLTAWQDGELTFTDSITAGEAAQLVRGSGDLAGSGDWWGELNWCLGQQGVAAWALALLSTLCAAACIVTFGIACAACIAAAIGISEGVIIACIAYANAHA